MAEVTRLELATSCVTGKHSNQLSYTSINGGHNWARTSDPLLVRQVLSQLSYATVSWLVRPRGIEPLLPGWKPGVLTTRRRPHTLNFYSFIFLVFPFPLTDKRYNIIIQNKCQHFFLIFLFFSKKLLKTYKKHTLKSKITLNILNSI